ncbi:hypothetical protein EZY14_002675 [Kordia sp. TARA_039_SRF]|nr:hypothetical protein EZY14_002675 [Kordia sp. TARA_039_SRF]
MLLINDFQKFIKETLAERDNLENAIIVASDDRANDLYKNTANAKDNCTIIGVIPSHNPKATDEDNVTTNNNIAIMVVKKLDSKAGNAVEINNFALCQLEIKYIIQKLKQYINSQEDCNWKNTLLNTISVAPLSNYCNANGYVLEFTSVNDFM